MRSRGAYRGLRKTAFRAFGIVIATTITYSSAPSGFNYFATNFAHLVEIEMLKFQGRPGPYSDRPTRPRERTSQVGRTPHFRGGIRNNAELADLMRNEQSRLARYTRSHPELALASTSPVLQPGGPGPAPVGDPELGEGSAGSSLGVGFSDRHEGGSGAPDVGGIIEDGWCNNIAPDGTWMGIPCIWPGGSGTGGGAGGTGGIGKGGGVESRIGLNTNTGNLVTAVPITGWSARGDSYVGFTLVHNSMQTAELGAITDIGHSWTHSYSIEVNYTTVEPPPPPTSGTTMYLIWMDAQRIKFTYSGIVDTKYEFTAPAGYHAQIYTDPGGSYFELKTKDGWSYLFNDDGYLTSQTDAWGNVITVDRNSSNEIISVIDNASPLRKLEFTYWSGKITEVKAPDNQVWKFTRDINGNLTKVEYPTLDLSTYDIDYTYNSKHDILTFTNKLEKTWTYTYAPDSELTSVKNPLLKLWSISYEPNLVTITNPEWGYIEHHYQDGRIISYVDEASYVVNFWADADENLTKVQDKRGFFWEWTYDSEGNVLTFKDPELYTSTYTYNADNNLTTVKDSLNTLVMTLDYDDGSGADLPAPTTVDDPLYNAVSYAVYDSLGEAQSTGYKIASVLHPKVTFTYNGQGDVTQMAQVGTGVTASGTYDMMGRPDTVTDTANETTEFFYDDWGRTQSLRLPDDSTISIAVNEGGQVTSATDELSRNGYVFYNDAGYVTSTKNAKDEVTSFAYDDIGRVEEITNARGKTRWYTYTPRHEVWTIQRPGVNGQIETWGYDANGNVTGYWPFYNSYKISYTYDDSGRELTVDYPTGTDTVLGYDSRGLWNSMTDATGTSSWVYNLLGQVTSLTTPNGNFTYGYDNYLGRPTTTVDVNGTWTALYDDYDRTSGSTNPFGETTTVSYDNAGRVNEKTLHNGMYETYDFDARSRPEYIKTYNSSDVLQDTKSYVWDDASRITSTVEGGITSTYGYDLIDQLTSEVKGAPLNYNAAYTYDANGNRLTRTVNGSTDTYIYDDADKLLTITNGATVRTYAYDSEGRTSTITDGLAVTTFNYNYEGEATSIVYPSTNSDSFSYNGMGARMSSSGVNGSKTVRRAGIGVTSSVLSDGTKEYTPRVSSRQNGASTFQHSGLKNATDQTDANENVTASRHYDAFGNLISSNGSWQGPFGYAGDFGYQEDGNGLKLLGHRYYDSDTGRFLTSDPTGAGKNWYSYCGSNPVNTIDPEGYDLTVIGSTDGIEGWTWAAKSLYGVGGKLLEQPTTKELVKALIEQEDGAEVMIWGHGSVGSISLGNGQYLTTKDIAYINAERKRLGKGKLGTVWLRACSTCVGSTGKKWLNEWLALADDVFGFTVGTTDGPIQHWDKPVTKDPRPRKWSNKWWGGTDKKKKKKGKKGTLGG